MKNQEYNHKIQDLKNVIKEKVNYQRELKRHRKTEKFEGERMKVSQKVWEYDRVAGRGGYVEKEVECTPQIAFELHVQNRFELRMMYAAYGYLRGKSLLQIENSACGDEKLTETNHPLNLPYFKERWMKIVEEYSVSE